MDVQLIASVVSSLLFTIGMSKYLYDVYKGRVRVSIVSMLMLGLINASQVSSLIARDLWYVVPFSATAAIMNLLICAVGYRNGTFQLTKLDISIFAGALTGLAVWFVTSDPSYNIYILTGVVLLSITPIVIKTFKDPTSETKMPWLILLAASFVLQLTITSPQPVAWLVQVRQLLFAGLINIALLKKR